VIRTEERMTYDDVNCILEGDERLLEKYAHVKDIFFNLDALRSVLTAKRLRRGALNFDFPEAKVVLNDKGEVVEIKKRRHGRAESIIEECMIVANETVAAEYFNRDIPFIYRVHDLPNDEKVMDLKTILAPFGYTLGQNFMDIKPHTFQRLLKKIKGTPAEYMLEMEILRTMSHAVYDTENRGHFGLASDCYCHFTSPIRRYPDLCIHRVIKDMLHMPYLSEEKGEKLMRRLDDAAKQSSLKERIAEDAERDAVDVKMAQYMAAHIGEKFSGVISGVTAYGFFVELENTVNGLVHVSSLEDDYYEFHPNTRTLMGTRNRICFRLGDMVHIRVARVNIDEHLIDFDFLDFLDKE
jgi:ribonuclease R